MTSSNLSTNMKRFFQHSLKSYWWLMLICGIAYFFCGPIYMLMTMDHVARQAGDASAVMNVLLQETANWFAFEGFYGYYVLAVLLAMMIGFIVFAYVHHKSQVNFYHSQPIKRGNLFGNQYCIGLLVNLLPMVLMVGVMVLIALFKGCGEAVSGSAVIFHLGRIALYSTVSYSVTVLAGQLTGTVLTHICMAGVLHFGIPAFVMVLQMLFEQFLDTFVFNQALAMNSLNFSPLLSLFAFFDQQNIYYRPLSYEESGAVWRYAYEGAAGLGMGTIAFFMAIAVICTVLAVLLYRKRPSEATGRALIYPVTEPILKLYLMTISAIVGGILFGEIGGTPFYLIFGIISFGLLTHMVCEIIIQKDFRALLSRMSHAVCFLVLIFALIGVVYFDLPGYDDYLPEQAEVAEIHWSMDGSIQGINYSGAEQQKFSGEVIEPMLTVLHKIVEDEQYLKKNNDDWDWERRGSIDVTYVLKNGSEVSRYYRGVSLVAIQQEFADLYDTEEYKTVLYDSINQLTGKDISYLSVNLCQFNNGGFSIETAAERDRILAALRQDLPNRTATTLTQGVLVELEFEQSQNDRGYRYQWLNIYPDDQYVMAVLAELNREHQWGGHLTAQEQAEQYQRLEVYTVAPGLDRFAVESQLLNQLDEQTGNVEVQEGIALIQTISGTENIALALSDLVSQAQVSRGGFISWDERYVILAIDKDASTGDGFSDSTDNMIAMEYAGQEYGEGVAVETTMEMDGANGKSIFYLHSPEAAWLNR